MGREASLDGARESVVPTALPIDRLTNLAARSREAPGMSVPGQRPSDAYFFGVMVASSMISG